MRGLRFVYDLSQSLAIARGIRERIAEVVAVCGRHWSMDAICGTCC